MATTNLEATIDIDAPVDKVWSAVSDLQRMPEWSPQCRKVFMRGPAEVGTTTVNINRGGRKVWPTRSKITVLQPDQKVEFKVLDNGTRWSYTLTPTPDGGTHVVQRRTVPARGTSKASQFLVDKFMGGNDAFEADLVKGMNQTLTRLKSALEN